MDQEFDSNIIYSQNTLDFVKTANDYCVFIENTKRFSKRDFIAKLQNLLPLIYSNALILPELDAIYDDGNERFVTEQQWFLIHDFIKTKMGYHDDYPEIFDPINKDQEVNSTASIADNLADIYQDLKNFAYLYHLGNEEIMNDAIWECKQNFEDYWGQILVNALRVLHSIYFSDDFIDEENEMSENEKDDQ